MNTPQETQAGALEQRGIELVPANERHGRPRDLFFLWLGTNANVFYVINGAILISLGLSFYQSLGVILLGNLAFFLLGLTSVQGPRTGTATFAINRAPFGPNGGRLLAFFNWCTLVGFEGSGLALAVIAILTLFHALGLPFSDAVWFKVVAILVIAAIQVYVPTLGHATIMAIQKVLAWVFLAFFAVVAIMIAGKVQVSGGHAGSFADLTIGFALMVSAGGISWANTGSDYSRYLPQKVRSSSVIWSSTLGGMIPAVLLEILGAAVATKLPGASDPISGLPSALAAWFLVPYLLLLFINLLAVNAIDLYSSGLTLQTIGIPVKRWQATAIDMVICMILAAIAIFSSSFNTLYGEFLALLIVFLAPWCAIYLVDAWMRRNRYDAAGLFTRLSGPYWYKGGVNPAGLIAQIGGMIASVLWLNSSLVQGPMSHVFNNSDMSVFTGLIVAGVLYWLLSRARVARQNKAVQQEVAVEADSAGVR
ncbi:allantoin permease [Dictyobacter sp. S3.2.2.5]|uniref:Allantoin permease n=1 Tax=Dictyobacter halimunensis TaxID=3026934 RepID=A0ABQ6FSN1_9CHLR|nr:allantoin permease [Dictyobacter sp. S3.2.2.5]